MKPSPQSKRLDSVCEHITLLTSVSSRGVTSLEPDQWRGRFSNKPGVLLFVSFLCFVG